MSKYIKLYDAIMAMDEWFSEPITPTKILSDLPTIEVSEDCISREDLLKHAYKREGVLSVSVESIKLAPSVTTEQSSMVGEVHKPDYSYESELMKRTSDTNTNAPGSKSHMLRPPCEQCPDWGNCKDGCLYERPKR